jgi:cob(I)alamin adenosyltransferase
MGKRLSKIYTKTGDNGKTGLGDGNRVSKTHPRIGAIGDVDELNSSLGVLIETLNETLKITIDQALDQTLNESTGLTRTLHFLRLSQHRIFDLGGELSIPGFEIITEEHVKAIEAELDSLNLHLAPLDNFILPGGSRLIAECHMARSICRRAERKIAGLAEMSAESKSEDVSIFALQYINRLSDYLFVVARYCALKTGVEEVLWQKG